MYTEILWQHGIQPLPKPSGKIMVVRNLNLKTWFVRILKTTSIRECFWVFWHASEKIWDVQNIYWIYMWVWSYLSHGILSPMMTDQWRKQGGTKSIPHSDTVDGGNPANELIWRNYNYLQGFIPLRWCRIAEPSTVCIGQEQIFRFCWTLLDKMAFMFYSATCSFNQDFPLVFQKEWSFTQKTAKRMWKQTCPGGSSERIGPSTVIKLPGSTVTILFLPVKNPGRKKTDLFGKS